MAVVTPQPPDERHRLNEDARVHLGLADAPRVEDNRHLDHPRAHLVAAIEHLDLEAEACRRHLVQVEILQDLAAEAAVAGGNIAVG